MNRSRYASRFRFAHSNLSLGPVIVVVIRLRQPSSSHFSATTRCPFKWPQIETVMKILGVLALLIGLVTMIFAVLADSELRTAATAATPPSPDSLPLTRIVAPELFDAGKSAIKPAELASMALNRIYAIGGASLVSLALGALLLMIKQTPESLVMRHEESDPTDSSLPKAGG